MISERNAISDCGRLRLGERAMRVEPCKLLPDLVEETVRLHIDRDRDGIGETERIRAAVALHGYTLQAQKDRAIVTPRIQPAAQPIERAARKKKSDPAQQ